MSLSALLKIFENFDRQFLEVFSEKTQLNACSGASRFVKRFIAVKKSATARAIFALCRVVVVGDTCVSEEGMATIVGRDKRYHVCGSAHGFFDAGELIRQHQPDILLIELPEI